MTLQKILAENQKHLALVIGNGINRYNSASKVNSWDKMLLELWEKHTHVDSTIVPQGISLTEFYDALDLSRTDASVNLQKEFCSLLAGWKALAHHQMVVDWATHFSCPILTTNFDESLSDSTKLSMHHLDGPRFTDFYPWQTYFAHQPIANPDAEFAIWHVNGLMRYSRSIRLGLSHYMGSVERARALIHKGDKRLFVDRHRDNWNGSNTWLDCIFHRDLLFIGLGLDSSEVFLRWLLIERAKYFKHFPKRKRNAWYVYAGTEISQGQQVFLRSVGCEIVKANSYDELYAGVWSI